MNFFFLLVGKKPSNINLLVDCPEIISAVIPATAPGAEVTVIPSSNANLVKSSPGSEIPGVPASVTKTIFFLLLKDELILALFLFYYVHDN